MPVSSLREARHGNHPAFPLEGHMFTVSGEVEPGGLRSAPPPPRSSAPPRRCSSRASASSPGLPALRRLAAEAADWPQQAEDWQWCARFAYQVIERRGTGGGNFRLMYSRFLEEAGYRRCGGAGGAAGDRLDRARARRSGRPASQSEADAGLWSGSASSAGEVLGAEERLWAQLAETGR